MLHVMALLVPVLLGVDWDMLEAQRAAVAPATTHAEVYHAAWCWACPGMNPVVQTLREEGWDIRFVDFDANRAACVAQGITNLPSTCVLQGSRVLGKLEGVRPVTEIRDLLTLHKCLRDPTKVVPPPAPPVDPPPVPPQYYWRAEYYGLFGNRVRYVLTPVQ